MAKSHIGAIDATIQKTNLILEDIESGLGWLGERAHAYSALRIVLHSLRDRLVLDSAVNFGAQLPMLVRGLYFEGWGHTKVPRKMSKEEFLDSVRKQLILPMDYDPRSVVRVVMNSLRTHLDPHEIEKIENILPKEFAEILE